jgi:predicted molibdopterin-dependent oxidoreductase YjgC
MAAGLRIPGAHGDAVRFRFDGQEIAGFAGETVAAALLAAGIRVLRDAPEGGGPRGLFCAMGVCQECVVEVDGRRIEACRLPVRDGLEVRRG